MVICYENYWKIRAVTREILFFNEKKQQLEFFHNELLRRRIPAKRSKWHRWHNSRSHRRSAAECAQMILIQDILQCQ